MSEDKRQQGYRIREALSSLRELQVEEDVYLKLEHVYDATRGILYPEGVETEEEYNRLTAISLAGCKAIGYSPEEVTLLPPVVSYSQRGTYLKKMPVITDQIIATLIDELVGKEPSYIDKPVIAIKREKLAPRIAHKHYGQAWGRFDKAEQEHLIQRGDEFAEKLGFYIEEFNDPPWLVGKIFYAKAMTPDFEAWREAVSQKVKKRAYPKIDAVKEAGLRAAFNHRVVRDPLKLISDQQWRDLFDELGFIYDQEQNELTPKPLNLSVYTTKALTKAISALPTYSHPKIGPFLIKDNLTIATQKVLAQTITRGRLDRLIADGVIGRILIKLGYKITSRWLSRYEFSEAYVSLPQTSGGEVFTRAMQVDPNMQTPAFAKGFRIHSPVLVRDEHTLIYMELLGPRQAVKANWAALRQRNRSHYLFGVFSVSKEDKLTTLKATLPCGWDHWCLIHRQASYDKLTPNELFYLIEHTPKSKSPPSTFIAFLAKSLAIPILPKWAEYLWISGRMKELITPLSENCYGFGGWKVETHEWNEIVKEGLGEGHITF